MEKATRGCFLHKSKCFFREDNCINICLILIWLSFLWIRHGGEWEGITVLLSRNLSELYLNLGIVYKITNVFFKNILYCTRIPQLFLMLGFCYKKSTILGKNSTFFQSIIIGLC